MQRKVDIESVYVALSAMDELKITIDNTVNETIDGLLLKISIYVGIILHFYIPIYFLYFIILYVYRLLAFLKCGTYIN